MCADLATESRYGSWERWTEGERGGGGDRVAKLIVLAEEIRENNKYGKWGGVRM